MAGATMEESDYGKWRERTFGGKRNEAHDQSAIEWLRQLRKAAEKITPRTRRLQRELRLIQRTIEDLKDVGALIRCPNQGARKHGDHP